ncbi:MAG: cysteine desulfurase [Clostridium sp.]|nr:cysteine desulfurase [Clostridium sp.]
MEREIYLDNSATTKPYDEVLDLIDHINRNIYGNPSSLHTKGIEAERLIRDAREIIARSLRVSRSEVYFTSGGTEANNLAIMGYLYANLRKGRHIITTKTEHPSILEVFEYMCGNGYAVDYLDVDEDGLINIDDIGELIKEDTSLISILYVNNETGAVQPIDDIALLKNKIKKDVVLHIDAVQAYGKLKIIPQNQGIDMLSISSHKIHGPKGIGALYVNKNIRVEPLIFGGGQENLLRSGTENVSGICGFGKAADITFKQIDESEGHCQDIKTFFIKKLKADIGDIRIISSKDSSPYILNVSFPGIHAEVLLHHLGEQNIFVSTGAACSSKKRIHSHVLKAMGLSPDLIGGAIRFSFSFSNTQEDIIKTVGAIKDILPKIKIRHGGRR